MRRFTSFFCLLLFLQSCSSDKQKEPFASLFKNCDQVNIVFYNHGDSLHFETKDANGVKIFTHLVSGNKEAVRDTCGANGDLIYLAKGQPFYTVQFALNATNSVAKCNYVQYNYQNTAYKHRLTEDAENILKQAYTSADTTKKQ